MSFREGKIEGVIVKDLKYFNDERGWLTEVFRHDELDQDLCPVMAYLSMSLPGVQRGPYAHKDIRCEDDSNSTYRVDE